MMSQHTQLSQTNGASLEDCHTNFFTLTDLCGIKWRVYTWESGSGAGSGVLGGGGGPSLLDPLEDPVLTSYARCLSADVLCVWRRSWRKPPPPPAASLDPLLDTSSQNNSSSAGGQCPSTSLRQSAKELWVFWYGDEPDLSSLVAPDLSKGDGTKGSWDWETGLSYECRTILFKALHNLIERCLLREDFVRLGKWFVQPYEAVDSNPASRNTHLSFSLSFFVHGESTVCASVDVRQQPPVRRLKPHHLTMAAAAAAQLLRSTAAASTPQQPGAAAPPPSASAGIPVLLAPYSLSATLTGASYRVTEPGIQKILDEWKQFFPLSRRNRKKRTRSNSSSSEGDDGESTRDRPSSACGRDSSGEGSGGSCGGSGAEEDTVPPVVEVLLGGFKLKYPSFYVLVTDLDDQTIPKPCPSGTDSTGVPPNQLPGDPTCDNTGTPPVPTPSTVEAGGSTSPHHTHSPFTASTHPLMQPNYLKNAGRGLGVSRGLAERVWQDVIQCHHGAAHHSQQEGGAGSEGALNMAELAGHWDFADPATKLTCNCSKCIGGSLYKGGCGVATPGSVPSLRTNSGGNGGGVGLTDGPPASVESQASITPSPLPTPHSHPPSVTPHHEPTMPTLSPQPPHSNASACGGDPGTPGGADLSSLDIKPNLADLLASTSSATALNKLGVTSQSMSPYPSGGGVTDSSGGLSTAGGSNTATSSSQAQHHYTHSHVMRGLKRPILPGSDYPEPSDSERHTSALYDTSKLDAWFVHPVKRFRATPLKAEVPLWPPYRAPHHSRPNSPLKQEVGSLESLELLSSSYPPLGGSSYLSSHVVPSGASLNGLPPYSKRLASQGSSPSRLTGSLKRDPSTPSASDPYIFDEDLATTNGLPDAFKRDIDIKEEPKNGTASPSSPLLKRNDNLFTGEGLQPSFSDLDKIFASDDSPVDDNHYPDHTPPGSNHSIGPNDDIPQLKGCGIGGGNIGGGFNSTKLGGGLGNSVSSTTTGPVSLGELAKMYPTPPSHEHNNNDHEAALEEAAAAASNSIMNNTSSALGPALSNSVSSSGLSIIKQEPPDPDYFQCHTPDVPYNTVRDDYKGPSIFWPTAVSMFVGSDRYKPLTDLPSLRDPVQILPGSVYKPSWQFNNNNNNNSSNSNNSNLNSNNNLNNSSNNILSEKLQQRPPSHLAPSHNLSQGQQAKLGSISPAVDRGGGPGSVGGPSSVGPSLGYELASPASNQSYLSKAVASVEPTSVPVNPEANSLVVNMVLMDSSLNLFRDHNFDSSTMCVCNNDQKVVGNVRGSDGALYLPPSHLSPSEEAITCNCGFSAVVNRRLAFQSGLFYEDEVDLTGMHEGLRTERKKPSLALLYDGNKNSGDGSERDTSILDNIPEGLFKLVQHQCVDTLGSTSSVVQRAAAVYRNTRPQLKMNLVDISDGSELVQLALDQARLDDSPPCSVSRAACLLMHKWAYIQYDGPSCSQDMARCMNALQPHLQEAIQKKRSSRPWEPVFNVRGPLTWRHFHRMAVRGTEDMAEPLPIPMLLAGHDRDWVSVAPQAIKHWERLMLEPYCQQRNIAYVVVSPDNEFVLNHVRSFFKELSSVYELCRLGRHAPIQRALRDGIMRVGKTAAAKVANESLDDWFGMLDDSQISTKLKFYSQVCRHRLAPHLLTLSMDKTLFEVGNSRSNADQQQRQASMSPMPPPSLGPDGVSGNPGQAGPTAPGVGDAVGQQQGDGYVSSSSGNVFGPGCSLVEAEEDEGPPPAIMVYLVDPFSVGHDHPEMHRLITLGLLRCYKQMLDCLPPQKQANVHVQIISLESIVELAADSHSVSRQADQLKCLAFSVFTQCRRFLTHTNSVRSLTGFGPASVYDTFLKPKDPNEDEKLSPPFPVCSPPFILASVKENRHKEAEEALGAPREKSTVLYCTYCLSEDQHWLLAVVTDNHGEMLETITINVDVPNRTRRKKASSRRPGLKKLMEWILGVMSTGVHPWRLVVGKMGRMGHGELKGWLHLLSRKSLVHSSKNLRDLCKQCDYLFPGAAPCILSACLVSLEPDSSFRMMPDIFTPDERFGQTSQNCNLNTPQDITSTHILVFPTSATAQSTQQRFQDDPPFQFGNEDDSLLLDENMEEISGSMDMGIGGFNYFEILGMEAGSGNEPDPLDEGGSGQQESLSQASSPSGGGYGSSDGRLRSSSPSQHNGQALSNGKVLADPHEDDTATLQQQPLALGYYISTASTGNLPRWFWSSCPHLENVCPVFLKSALHLNQPAVTQAEDVLPNTTAKAHPLDSNCTADVLRFVLEGYNGLSWLVLDPTTQDRRSCLPLHMQTLSNLYNAMAALV